MRQATPFALTPTPFFFLESLPVENVRLPGNVPLLPSKECRTLRDYEFFKEIMHGYKMLYNQDEKLAVNVFLFVWFFFSLKHAENNKI